MKRLLMVFVFVIMFCSTAWGAYEKSGIVYYPTDGTSAAALLVGIEAKGTPCTMKFIHTSGVSTPYEFPSGVTFPEYATLEFEDGAMLSGSGIRPYSPANIHADQLQQIYTSGTSVVYQIGGTVYPGWHGAPIDGTDCSTEIQAAFDSILTVGGTVEFYPSGIYGIGSQINIVGSYPINIVSKMYEVNFNGTDDVNYGGYIKPLSSISGSTMFYIASDDSRSINPGALISGLFFTDDSALDEAPAYNRRAIPVTAIHFADWDYGRMENCTFRYIEGTAFETNRAIKSGAYNCVIELCGASGKPSININSDSSTNVTQSFVFDNCRIEANYFEDDVWIDDEAGTVTFNNCNFEKDDTDESLDYNYIDSSGTKTKIIGCSFNKSDAVQILLRSTAQESIINSCTFDGDNIDGRIQVDAAECIISDFTFDAASSNTGYSLIVNGSYSVVNSGEIRRGGGIYIPSNNNVISNLSMSLLDAVGVPAINNTGKSNIISNIVMEGNGSASDELTGGIVSSGLYANISDCVIKTFAGDFISGVLISGAHSMIIDNEFIGLSNVAANAIVINSNNNSIDGNHFLSIGSNVIVDNGSSNLILNNFGATETVTTDAQTLNHWGVSILNSSSGNLTGTLPDGEYEGEQKTIIMSAAGGNIYDLTVTSHATSSPEIFRFDSANDALKLEWSVSKWFTVANSGVTTP